MTTLILLFFTLAFLEVMLSGDNAVVLASMASKLKGKEEQSKALTIGMIGSYILRVLVIIFGVWIFNNPVLGPGVKFLGAGYLLYLFADFFFGKEEGEDEGLVEAGFWATIASITLADLAFSLDSATTALALSDNLFVILAACGTGVVALRFLAGWFVELIEIFTHLEAAGYIAVGFVGVQLLVKTFTDIEISELIDVAVIVVIFLWGFSVKNTEETK